MSGCNVGFYGLVVDSVNVIVFVYVFVCSGLFAAIGCLKLIAMLSLETGVEYVFSVVGRVELLICSGEVSVNELLIRWFGVVELVLVVVSVASLVDEVIVVVVEVA